ncbi:MAG: PilZ domain-containing protein, partial [Dyella sp.]|nr:PilZ domain-containing protein [Dyella sp.]
MSKAEDNARNGSDSEQLRPARMRIETTVLMSRGGESHPTELVDISATGVLLRRP